MLLVAGAAGLVALIVAVDPRSLGGALARVGWQQLPVFAALSVSMCLLQGVRWHQLLRAAGVTIRPQETVLVNTAGQATGLLPLGELTRVVLVSDATRTAFGTVLATVTVQELIFTAALVLVAMPGALGREALIAPLAAALLFVIGIFTLLGTHRLWRPMRRLLSAIPPFRAILGQLDALQSTAAGLLRRRDTLVWSTVSLVHALVAVTLLWRVVAAVDPGAISLRDAALVYTASHLAGAVSAVPGGIGAYEASLVGLLVAFGVHPAVAAAAALLNRCFDKGLQSAIGAVALVAARRRLLAAPRPPAAGATARAAEAG